MTGDNWTVRNASKLIKKLEKLWPQITATMALFTSNLWQVTAIYELECECDCDCGAMAGSEADIAVAAAILPNNAHVLDSRVPPPPHNGGALGWNHVVPFPSDPSIQNTLVTQASLIAGGVAQLICTKYCKGESVKLQLDYDLKGGEQQIYE